MIISQAPYRVSFAGGGIDLPAFCRHEYGAVLSTTIEPHIDVTIHGRFEPNIRVSDSRTEVAEALDEVRPEIVREAMRIMEMDVPLEITAIGDVPAGTGMGSSSGAGNLDRFAEWLHHGWVIKQSLGCGISNEPVDHWYAAARRAGTAGGELLGAGGRGFLLPERVTVELRTIPGYVLTPPFGGSIWHLASPLMVCNPTVMRSSGTPWWHRAIRDALGRPRELVFRIARHGSRIILIHS